MHVAGTHIDSLIHPIGRRRGISDVARFALDLNPQPKRVGSEAAGPFRAYPSPPMSGSPPLPPASQFKVGDRSHEQGSFRTDSPQDVHRGLSANREPIGDARNQHRPPPSVRSYQTYGEPARMGFYGPPDNPMQHSYPYSTPAGQVLPPPPPQPSPYHPSQTMSTTAHHPSYTSASLPPPPTQPPPEMTPFGSPKSGRKAKGHVASACVPCKRAHLRCDAQRPCSRCAMNGKEEACIDVQHKKRGRPRLRDDRDGRFDPSRFPGSDASMQRPLAMYTGGSMDSGYEATPRRNTQSYRVLKSQPSEPLVSRYIEHASSADANMYSAPLSIATRPPEPVAFVTMDMEVARASPVFAEAIGINSINGQKLWDVIVLADKEKVHGFQRQMQEEQTRKEPNYLPPIFGKQEESRVIQSLGFGADQISRYHLDRQDRLTFHSADGQARTYMVRLGLAKVESIYFIVLVLNIPSRFPYPSPSPHAREIPYGYSSQSQQAPPAFAQHTPPVSATFGPPRPRFGDSGGLGPRQGPAPSVPGPQTLSGLGPAVNTGMSSYPPSQARHDYQGLSSYLVPRSEQTATPLPPSTAADRPRQHDGSFQLPPIRSQPQVNAPGPDASWPREDRTNRVDIGGLIDKPEQSYRRQ